MAFMNAQDLAFLQLMIFSTLAPQKHSTPEPCIDYTPCMHTNIINYQWLLCVMYGISISKHSKTCRHPIQQLGSQVGVGVSERLGVLKCMCVYFKSHNRHDAD